MKPDSFSFCLPEPFSEFAFFHLLCDLIGDHSLRGCRLNFAQEAIFFEKVIEVASKMFTFHVEIVLIILTYKCKAFD